MDSKHRFTDASKHRLTHKRNYQKKTKETQKQHFVVFAEQNNNHGIISDMYNYSLVDEDGNPIGSKKKQVRISKQENNFLISVGFLWQELASSYLDLRKDEVVMKNIYYPIREVYNREKWSEKDFKGLFQYFFNDKQIPHESKLSFDLCMSQKYVAKYKLSNKKQVSSVSLAEEMYL